MPGSDGLRIWVFWKTRQLGIRLWASRVGSLLGTSPVEFYERPVELGTRLGSVQLGVDFGHVESWSWVKTTVLRSLSVTMEFSRFLPTELLKTTRCAERLSFVSIEWLRTVCVFLSSYRRTELRSQEVNKRSYLNNGVACVFESARLYLYIYTCSCIMDI